MAYDPTHEKAVIEIAYVDMNGEDALGDFPPDELTRCPTCDRYQPTAHLQAHYVKEHGRM